MTKWPIVNFSQSILVHVLSMNSLLGTISDHGGVTNPECGSGYSVPKGEGLSFFCRPPLYGRYVTIRSLLMKNALTLCEVEVYSERRGKLHNICIFSVDASDDNGDSGCDKDQELSFKIKNLIHFA